MAYVNLEMTLSRCRQALDIQSRRSHYVDDTPVVLVEAASELGMKIIASQRELRSRRGSDYARNFRQSIVASSSNSPFNFINMFQGANEWDGGHHYTERRNTHFNRKTKMTFAPTSTIL